MLNWLMSVLCYCTYPAVVSFVHIEHLAAVNGHTTLATYLLPRSFRRHGRGPFVSLYTAATVGGMTATRTTGKEKGTSHQLSGPRSPCH